jgi:predicted metal-dependent peptidase
MTVAVPAEQTSKVAEPTSNKQGKSRKDLTKEEADFYKLIRLRATQAGIGQPYIANAIFRLTPISAPGLGTMGVDKFWRCYIDFDFMMEKGVEYAAGVLAHEPWHLLRGHNERAERIGADKTPFLWNIAGDLEINDDIMNLVPKDSLFPGKGQFADYPANQIAEFYYEKVKEEADKNKPKCPVHNPPQNQQGQEQGGNSGQGQEQGGNSGQGQEQGGNSGQGQEQGQNGSQQGQGNQQGQGQGGNSGQGNQQGQGQQGEGSGSGQGGNEGCSCGKGKGGQGGNSGSGQGGLDGGNCGSGTEKFKEYEIGEDGAESVDADEAESIRKQVAEAIRRHEMSNPGSIGGNAKLWADEVLAHKPVSWKQVLRGQIKDAIAWKRGHTDYNRKRPARRQPVKDVMFPALRSPQPRIGLAIDTSGSNLGNLGVVLDEISRITKQVGVRGQDLLAFSVDTRKVETKFQPVNDVKKLDLNGGGGTDMRVAYEELANLKGKVDIGIVLTDGETPWPTQAPTNAVKFITLIMVQQGSSWAERVIADAEKAVGSWSKIVVIEVEG